MKTLTFSTLFLFLIAVANISAQESTSGERYGHTLNIGLGLGYYGYVGHTIPVIHADYEFGVLRNFTLAPFVSFYSYSNGYYYNGSKNQNS